MRLVIKFPAATRSRPTPYSLKKPKVEADPLLSANGVSWYRVCHLGQGGFGTIYLANTQETDGLPSQIAVKSTVLSKSSSLQNEKQLLCTLNGCPYVIHCYGDEVTQTAAGEKVYNVLLEYCSGMSLEREIKKMGHIPEVVVRTYTRDIVRGLKYIHDRGYAHCDIKPDNILLVPSRSSDHYEFAAKIADLGLAKEIGDGWDTDMGEIRGTLCYMSPELVREQRLSYAVDIWALGCSLVEMLNGEAAWDYSVSDQLIREIAYGFRVPQIQSNICDYISDDFKDFINKCLQRDVVERWTADQLLQHPFIATDWMRRKYFS